MDHEYLEQGTALSEDPDKLSRKDKLHEWRAQQRAAARAKLPLADAEMRALFDMLDEVLPVRGCDHTLRFVGEWAQRDGVTLDALVAWCHENGGHCDCEVLANCEQRWRDAIHDVNW
jgi:hypothetical protein